MEVSTERAVVSQSTELMVRQEPEQKSKRTKRRIGKHALAFDGFVPMGHVESKFAPVRSELQERIIDQPEAIDAIIEALERSEIRLPNDKRPIASLAFLGPTGVGKSETAKVLSELLDKDEPNIIKIDCSNFSHGHEVASLTGSPPGYVGHNITPVLEKSKVEKPGTVILFDEIEKGSPELYNLMLQIMGDGELQLNNGDVALFRDTVIIITSNLGAKEMTSQLSKMPFGLGAIQQEVSRNDLEKTATKAFTHFFKPEFINRLNKLVVFHPLTTEGLGSVLDVKLAEVNEEYEKQLGVRLSLSDATRDFLVNLALEEAHNGARPLVRALEDHVQTEFGRHIGSGSVLEGTHVRVYHASEAPDDYEIPGGKELIFTSIVDETIEKESTILARIDADARTMKALPANPEDYYTDEDVHDLDDHPQEDPNDSEEEPVVQNDDSDQPDKDE